MEHVVFAIRHLFTPHHSNNFRPKVLHHSFLTIGILALLAFQTILPFIHAHRPDILGFATNITIEQLLRDTNNERAKQGKGSLVLNASLSKAAENKAHDMFAQNYWAHVAPDGKTPWDFILGEGYRYTYAGENLARDFNDSDSVVVAWMNSPSHRDNLLRGEYEEIGFAVVNGKLNGEDTTLVVQMFGTKQPSYVARNRVAQASNEALAEEIIPSVTVTPVPSVTIAISKIGRVIIPPVQAAEEAPLIDFKSLEKGIGLTIMSLLAGVLLIDGYLIWKHKVIRIAGHNLAHFIFLITLAGIIIFSMRGAVL